MAFEARPRISRAAAELALLRRRFAAIAFTLARFTLGFLHAFLLRLVGVLEAIEKGPRDAAALEPPGELEQPDQNWRQRDDGEKRQQREEQVHARLGRRPLAKRHPLPIPGAPRSGEPGTHKHKAMD